MVIVVIAAILFLLYSSIVLYYWIGWKSIPEFIPSTLNAHTKVSVVIPARNEEDNIGVLLKALESQTYPRQLFQVIVVNDHSTDKTAAVVKAFNNVILLDLPDDTINSYKKKAIELGIAQSSGELIVTTDADCLPSSTWLETIVIFQQQNDSSIIAAPVSLTTGLHPATEKNWWLSKFQILDFMILQGITGASVHRKIHTMANGANLTYKKKVFDAVNGFQGIDNIASGDDMLLMEKMARAYPGGAHYLKSKQAIVQTQPMASLNDFLNQRTRWASKARFYKSGKITSVLAVVYLFNLLFLALLVEGIFNWRFFVLFLILWVIKTLVELPLVVSVARFFSKQTLLTSFFFFQPLHIAYTVVAGFLGQFKRYEWKGRVVK